MELVFFILFTLMFFITTYPLSLGLYLTYGIRNNLNTSILC